MVTTPMPQVELPAVVSRWLVDASFRQELRRAADKAAYVREAGIELTPEHEELLGRVDWDLTDEQFQDRLDARLQVVTTVNENTFCPTYWHGTCPCLRRGVPPTSPVNPPVTAK